MLENHDKIQLIGIGGIALSYILTVIFNAVNGIGGIEKSDNIFFALSMMRELCILARIFANFRFRHFLQHCWWSVRHLLSRHCS